jgi:hypothetical protein
MIVLFVAIIAMKADRRAPGCSTFFGLPVMIAESEPGYTE